MFSVNTFQRLRSRQAVHAAEQIRSRMRRLNSFPVDSVRAVMQSSSSNTPACSVRSRSVKSQANSSRKIAKSCRARLNRLPSVTPRISQAVLKLFSLFDKQKRQVSLPQIAVQSHNCAASSTSSCMQEKEAIPYLTDLASFFLQMLHDPRHIQKDSGHFPDRGIKLIPLLLLSYIRLHRLSTSCKSPAQSRINAGPAGI